MPNPRLFVEIAADSSQFQQAMSNAQNTIQGAGQKIQNTGAAIGRAGATLTKGVTLPLVGVGVAATKAAVDWESAFTGVRKTVNATESELAALETGLRALALDIPVSAGELAGIAEAAGQLGIATPNILDFTKTMAELGVTTNLTADEAATALAQFANVTGMDQGDFDRLGSTIVALGNNLATTEADIVSMAQRLAGAGSIIGLSNAEIVALSGALSSVGINAEAGGTAFSRIMSDMASAVASGGKELTEFADVAGVSADAFGDMFKADPAQALVSFIEGIDRLNKEGANTFAVLDDMGLGGVRIRDSLLRAAGAGDLFRNAIALGNDAWAENNALSNEAALRFGTMESKLQTLKNRFAEMLITVGGPLIDALTAALVAAQPFLLLLSEWATKFAEAEPDTQRLALTIAGIAAAAGPVLGILGGIISGIGGLVTAIGAVPGIVGGASAAIGAIAAVLTGPLGIAIALIIALVGAVALAWKNNWGDIQGKTAAVVAWFKTHMLPVLQDIGTIILFLAQIALGALGDALGGLEGPIRTIAEVLRTILAPAFDWVIEKTQGITNWIGGFAQGVRDLRGGGGAGTTPAAAPTGSLGPEFFHGGGPGVGGTGFSAAGGGNQVNFNAPLASIGSVRNDQDRDAIMNSIREELQRALDLQTNQQTRFPIGTGSAGAW